MKIPRTTWILVFLLIAKACVAVDNQTIMTCRTERGVGLSLEEYKLDTCARCYVYLPPFAFSSIHRKLKYNPSSGQLFDSSTNTSHSADPDNTSHPVYDTFQSDIFARKWIACCREAIECCNKMQLDPMPPEDAVYCPRTWDGWQCWPDTGAGETASSPCQEHVYFRSEPSTCPKFAEKRCWDNGTWYINEWNNEWSNYSGCGRVERMKRLQNFHIATYAVSIFFLLPALFIFTTYKQLQVHRITLHKNLFLALLVNAALVITFKAVVILDELDNSGDRRTILEENWVGCRLLHILTKYSRMCTYMWMFCEGFYLHKLIAAAFAEQKSLRMFYFIGWVFPIFPVGTVALLRWNFADEQCWAVPVKPYEWVANSLNLLSLFLNLMFLINIIRVLWTKLRATHANEPSQFRKAVRATLVLVPLFGLHFFLVMYRPQSGDCFMLEGYSYFSYAMDGLQGLLVSLIFCYLNGEKKISDKNLDILWQVFSSKFIVKLDNSAIFVYTDPGTGLEVVPEAEVAEEVDRFVRLAKIHSIGNAVQQENTAGRRAPVIELIRRSVDRFRLQRSLDVHPTSMTATSELSVGRSRQSADTTDYSQNRLRRSVPNNSKDVNSVDVTVELNLMANTDNANSKDRDPNSVETSLINHDF